MTNFFPVNSESVNETPKVSEDDAGSNPPKFIGIIPDQTNTIGDSVSLYIFDKWGNSPLSFDVFNGPLPTGLSLNAGTGYVSGTITGEASVFAGIEFVASNSGGLGDKSNPFAWTVNAAPLKPKLITELINRSNTLEQKINIPLTGFWENEPASFSLFSGPLPAGIELNVETGELFGTFSALGVYDDIIIAATNDVGTTQANAFTWSIYPAITATQMGQGFDVARKVTVNVRYGR